MSDFKWPDVSYFQAKFGLERVKASKVILNYSKLSRFDKPFGGCLAPPCILVWNRVWFSRELQECTNVLTVSVPNE